MGDRHDDYEPIIAPRRSRQPRREEAPLWRTILGVVAVFAVVILLAWWWSHRPPDTERAVSPTPAGREALPETHVEQEIVPPARDPGAPVETPERSAPQTVPEPENAASEPPAASDTVSESEDVPEVEPESVLGAAIESPSESEPVPQAPAHVSVRFTSPDSQVRVGAIHDDYRGRDVGDSAGAVSRYGGCSTVGSLRAGRYVRWGRAIGVRGRIVHAAQVRARQSRWAPGRVSRVR
jgi:hypothetical protein